MGQKFTAKHIRDLLKLAKQMRSAAANTNDHIYIDMFLRAAMGLEEKANDIAQTGLDREYEESEISLRGPVNLTC